MKTKKDGRYDDYEYQAAPQFLFASKLNEDCIKIGGKLDKNTMENTRLKPTPPTAYCFK